MTFDFGYGSKAGSGQRRKSDLDVVSGVLRLAARQRPTPSYQQ
jgi:hypothetical protein